MALYGLIVLMCR